MSYSQITIGGSGDPSLSGDLTTASASFGYGLGGVDAGSYKGFVGSMQKFTMNGQEFFELAATGQLNNHKLNAIISDSSDNEASVHHAVSFTAQNTYIGLPQMKVYNSINIRFLFRTFEQNGLLLYNPGKASDFIAVELVNGRLHYTLNLGYGAITIKDTAPERLSDNKWHQVRIMRVSKEYR